MEQNDSRIVFSQQVYHCITIHCDIVGWGELDYAVTRSLFSSLLYHSDGSLLVHVDIIHIYIPIFQNKCWRMHRYDAVNLSSLGQHLGYNFKFVPNTSFILQMILLVMPYLENTMYSTYWKSLTSVAYVPIKGNKTIEMPRNIRNIGSLSLYIYIHIYIYIYKPDIAHFAFT